ncbi:MAG: hypothetical protein E6Q98_18215 [Rhodospirillaceae bacterium]|nr:MAG: hypothetical protein E6Q98_18215 [Rhodospirillaceae bacterium]
MTKQIKSIFNPVVASEARKMVAQGHFQLISVADFPRGTPTYDQCNRLAYFALQGTDADFEALGSRVADRLKFAAGSKERDALFSAMATV